MSDYDEMKQSENQIMILGRKYQVPFLMPITENLIVFGCSLVICIVVPIITYYILQKGSVVEQLRIADV